MLPDLPRGCRVVGGGCLLRHIREKTMDKITIKTPNPKGRLFCKLYLSRDLAAGVYLSEAPSPPRFLFVVVRNVEGSESVQIHSV
jgi:hypothetical protein